MRVGQNPFADIGVSRELMRMVVKSPSGLRDWLGAYRRSLARITHPDTASISTAEAARLNSAFSTLLGADDTALLALAVEFADDVTPEQTNQLLRIRLLETVTVGLQKQRADSERERDLARLQTVARCDALLRMVAPPAGIPGSFSPGRLLGQLLLGDAKKTTWNRAVKARTAADAARPGPVPVAEPGLPSPAVSSPDAGSGPGGSAPLPTGDPPSVTDESIAHDRRVEMAAAADTLGEPGPATTGASPPHKAPKTYGAVTARLVRVDARGFAASRQLAMEFDEPLVEASVLERLTREALLGCSADDGWEHHGVAALLFHPSSTRGYSAPDGLSSRLNTLRSPGLVGNDLALIAAAAAAARPAGDAHLLCVAWKADGKLCALHDVPLPQRFRALPYEATTG